MSVKIERLNDTFVEEISYILMTEVKDQNIKFVTLTDCEITSDLSFAKVFYTVLDLTKKEETDKALRRAAPFIRGKLSERVNVRHTPELKFIYDDSIEYGTKIENILDKINNEQEN